MSLAVDLREEKGKFHSVEGLFANYDEIKERACWHNPMAMFEYIVYLYRI